MAASRAQWPDRAALVEGAAQLGVPLDDRQTDRLIGYVEMLAKWNRVVNLTAVDGIPDMLTLHILDCLAVIEPLRRRAPKRLLDVGSGAGLPGVIVAIALPDVEVTCVDSVSRKIAFVRQAAAELGISLSALHSRVEQLGGAFDIVASRAFASLRTFVQASRERVTADGAWMAMKGRVPLVEIAALPAGVVVFHVERLRVPKLGAERCLVWMRVPSARNHKQVHT